MQLVCGVAGPLLDVFLVLARRVSTAWFVTGFGEADPAWRAVAVLGSRAGSELPAWIADADIRRLK